MLKKIKKFFQLPLRELKRLIQTPHFSAVASVCKRYGCKFYNFLKARLEDVPAETFIWFAISIILFFTSIIILCLFINLFILLN